MTTQDKPLAKTRVIIADDNAMMRDKVVMLLEPEFEVVAAVSDGEALVDAVPRFDPDLGVIDISMPRKSGIEAARQLRDNGSKMILVFLTVHEDPDFARAAFDVGATGYVVKSRMVTDLLSTIRGALKGKSSISPSFALNDTVSTRKEG
jgi:DNA-binding NarL/FixJ family response regulator